MTTVPDLLPVRYDARLVVLSLLIAMLASYVALDMAGRTTEAQGSARRWWLVGGSVGMGIGIWSMHYIGMLAFSLPIPVRYDVPTVLLSLLAAMLASWVALLVVSRRSMSPRRAAVGSLVMGAGIAAMHYIGMAAMHMQATTHWRYSIVAASVVIAVVVSFVALRLTFHFRSESRSLAPLKLATAAMMGLAIVVMHYTGMAAATFEPADMTATLRSAVEVSKLDTIGITMVTFMVLALAVLTGVVDRRLSAQAQELVRSEARFRRLFERSLAGVYRSTRDGRLLDCNEACARILGFPSREACLRTDATDLYPSAAEREEFMARLVKERRLSDVETTLRRRDGHPIWVHETATLVDAGGGEPEVIEGTLIDISERKQAEEALRQSEARLLAEMAERERAEVALRLKQKLESVGQLAAGIAHEINTPVQYVGDSMHFVRGAYDDIRRLLELYRENHVATGAAAQETERVEQEVDLQYLDESVPAAFERIADGIDRVSAIVRAIKEFGRPDSREPVLADLNQALKSTLVVSRGEWKYVAETHVELADLPPVRCHVGDLNQVFLNLIVNAAHAIEAANASRDDKRLGRIELRSRVDGGYVVITVADTGCGIPAEIQGRVFDPFFTTKEIGRGSGQGLAISRAIVVDKHGGALEFETREGEGTTFIVKLPIDGSHSLENAA